MKQRYTTPVVFSVNGTITLTQSQLSELGIGDVADLQEIFDLFRDTLVEAGFEDPDELLLNYEQYGITDPSSIDQWLEFFFSLEF